MNRRSGIKWQNAPCFNLFFFQKLQNNTTCGRSNMKNTVHCLSIYSLQKRENLAHSSPTLWSRGKLLCKNKARIDVFRFYNKPPQSVLNVDGLLYIPFSSSKISLEMPSGVVPYLPKLPVSRKTHKDINNKQIACFKISKKWFKFSTLTGIRK